MKKRILSMVLCVCMALTLLPMSALAASYNSWEAAMADGVTLNEGDTVTIDGTDYIYKVNADTTGISMKSGDFALTENCCWKAGSGYVLYKPTVENDPEHHPYDGIFNMEVTTSAEVTLHDATISASGGTALVLPSNSPSSTTYPVDTTVHVEGTNSLTTTDKNYSALYHQAGDTTFTGGGTLTLTNSATNAWRNFDNSDGVVTIEDGTQVALHGGSSQLIDDLTVTGSGSKLTIADGTTLAIGLFGGNPAATVTVKDGGVLENNGTLTMGEKVDKDNSHIVGEISGSGVIKFGLGTTPYCLVDGVFYPNGGDVSTSGLNLSGKNNDGTDNSAYNVPTEVTRYKAGSGYAVFTPANGGTHAKLELNNATINTTSGRALYLPAEPVDITVSGTNTLTANGSYNYAIDPNGQAVSITGNGNLTLAGNKGIASWSGGTPGVIVDIGGDLEINTTRTYSITSNGDINLSAASITTGIIQASGSFTATAKTGNLTIDNGESSSLAVVASNITMEAPNGAISVIGKGNILLETSGIVAANAKGDIAFTSSNTGSVALYFGTGVSMTSAAGSIDVTTSGYSCIEKTSSGAGGGAVTLSAAKDIKLNAEHTAISASNQAVYLTAGGTMTSTSAYGFQTGALTIKANEVSIAGTKQDGIQATSVSITNADGTSNCKRVSVTATSSQDTRAAIHALGSATTGNITVKADNLFICGNDSAKAISALGTVTIDGAGLIIGAISAGTENIAAGIARASKSGGKISDKLDLKTNTPTEITYYEIDNGTYIIFAPKSGNKNAMLTLHNVYNAGYLTGGIILPDEPITLKLEGVNIFFEITASNNITISGNGLLDSEINNSNADAVLTVENGATLKAMYRVTADGIDNITVYGNYICDCVVGNTTKLKLNAGAVLQLSYNNYLEFKEGASLDNLTIGEGASIMNDTHMTLPKGTTVEQIKALPLSGTGIVRVAKTYDSNGIAATWDTYTNNGVKVNEITGGIDLTSGVDHSDKTVASDGYAWDSASSTLTLGNHAYVSGGIILPDNATINTAAASTISGMISGAGGTHMNLTFTGTAPITINGGIFFGTNGDTVTVQNGAHVVVNGIFSLGAYGLDGILNVSSSGTTLSISSDNNYAVMCGAVNVQNGASLTVKTAGTDSVGLRVLKPGGSVSVTGGSTLTAGCDYGVLIIDGKLTVDDNSKLITNGAIAPFCIIDTTSTKVQKDVLSLANMPSDTEIASVLGTTEFSGSKHKYWSLIPKNGSLGVKNEMPDFATLTGAKTGTVTFVKAASSGGSSGGSGGSGGSISTVSYKLSFETNGGAKLSDVSKENGTTIDLASYKPTREGYDFDGWYADKALTEKVTSVKLTKNTTVYAKWTEKPAKAVNPFADVSENAYYHNAVLWAVQKNVTSGTTNTAFSPDMICTRAQMVTFLWRAMGSPEPTSANCPFTDVSKDAYYYKAVLWAVEKGITAGASASTFSPNATVTRGQSVTFMWRAAGKPAVTASANSFADVSKDAFCYNAMLWAVEKGITQGTSSTTFSPSGSCTRSQIVTFLYRYVGK